MVGRALSTQSGTRGHSWLTETDTVPRQFASPWLDPGQTGSRVGSQPLRHLPALLRPDACPFLVAAIAMVNHCS